MQELSWEVHSSFIPSSLIPETPLMSADQWLNKIQGWKTPERHKGTHHNTHSGLVTLKLCKWQKKNATCKRIQLDDYICVTFGISHNQSDRNGLVMGWGWEWWLDHQGVMREVLIGGRVFWHQSWTYCRELQQYPHELGQNHSHNHAQISPWMTVKL